jgi:uncharacterized surface protein with fasciclin (FAS1) repeats
VDDRRDRPLHLNDALDDEHHTCSIIAPSVGHGLETKVRTTTALILLALLAVATSGVGPGCGDAEGDLRPTTSETRAAVYGGTLLEALDAHGHLSMLNLIEVAGLEERLSTPGPYTLVAPDDAAFGSLPAGELTRLFGAKDRARAFVLDHLLAGRVPPDALTDGLLTQTMYLPAGLEEAAHSLRWSARGGELSVDGALVTGVVELTSGVLYVVDRPLPPAPEAWASPATVSAGERVTVSCRCMDGAGRPVAGARCTFGWHFGEWMPHDQAVTDARGIARCRRLVPRDAVDPLLVTVTVRGALPTRTVVATVSVH